MNPLDSQWGGDAEEVLYRLFASRWPRRCPPAMACVPVGAHARLDISLCLLSGASNKCIRSPRVSKGQDWPILGALARYNQKLWLSEERRRRTLGVF
jgi:hypothetical protein